MIKKKPTIVNNTAITNIKTTYNNTLVTISDLFGKTLCWSSAGETGLKGTRKKTPFAAQQATKNAVLKALNLGIKKTIVFFNGNGNGRDAALRAIKGTNLIVLSIHDKIIKPHNGCRPPKKRKR